MSRRIEALFVLGILAALLVFQWKNPSFIAQRLNQKGIARYALDDFEGARRHFEEALALAVKPHVVELNLGDESFRTKDFAGAHQRYQESLGLRGDFLPAAWNDAFALYAWGGVELDSNYCHIERTEALWRLAQGRFHALTGEGGYARPAASNEILIEAALRHIRAMHESNRGACGGGGGGGSQKPNAQAARTEGQGDPKAGNPPSRPDPYGTPLGNPDRDGPSTGAGELSETERRELAKAGERIERQAAGATLRQSSAQQMREGKDRENMGKAGKPQVYK